MKILSSLLYVGILAMVTTMLTGCGNDSPTFSFLPAGQSFKQSTATFNNQLDILWVVDNSSSMQPLQTNMVSNFQSFISNFQNQGYDFKMAVTTTDAYLADPNLSNYNHFYSSFAQFKDGISNPTGIFVMTPTTPNLNSVFVNNATTGANGDGDERAFSSFRTALNSSSNSGFLRTNSYFAIIILSDEDDFSGNGRCQECGTDHSYSASTLDTVATYETYLDTLTQSTGVTRRYNVSAISVLDNTCLQSHIQQSSSSIIGQRYIQIAGDTNGTTGSICDASYANALNNIQSNIATLSTQFFLQRLPQPSTIVVTVNNATEPEDATNGWTYDSTANSILFHGTAIPPQNASIDVNFIPAQILN